MRPERVPALAGAGVAVLAAAGCTADVACPAIGYSSSLTVALADDWPGRDRLDVDVACLGEFAQACGELPAAAGPERRDTLFSAAPRVAVTVLRDGVAVERVEVDVDWQVTERPHGPACGGPLAAEVVVAPPSA